MIESQISMWKIGTSVLPTLIICSFFRFLYEHPPANILKLSNKSETPKPIRLYNVQTLMLKPPKTEKPILKDKRYRKSVPTGEKLQMISDFMDCRFKNYLDLLESQVSRQFMFKLPDPALGHWKGRLTPLMISKVYLSKAEKECKKTKLRIMKVIRLSVNEILEDVQIGEASLIDPDYKVIVLIRYLSYGSHLFCRFF